MNADNILELQGASDEDLLMAERVQKEVLSGKITPLREKGHIAGWKKGVMGLLTFATSAIAIACSTPPRSPESTPTLPVPTIPASELTPGANFVGKDGSLPPKETPTPVEVKKLNCDILSPEACATGKYIQWALPSGRILKGMGFTLEVNEPIRISEDLQVAGEQLPQDHFYKGYSIAATRKDGKRYLFWGAATPAEDSNGKPVIGDVGKDLPVKTVIATITGKDPVFKQSPYNFVTVYPSEEELNNVFPEQTKKQPEVIPNQLVTANQTKNPAEGGGLTFFGPKPPQ